MIYLTFCFWGREIRRFCRGEEKRKRKLTVRPYLINLTDDIHSKLRFFFNILYIWTKKHSRFSLKKENTLANVFRGNKSSFGFSIIGYYNTTLHPNWTPSICIISYLHLNFSTLNLISCIQISKTLRSSI